MKEVIRFQAHGYAANCETEPEDSMFLCQETLNNIWDADLQHGQKWTVCLQKRTTERRPYVAAIKLDIPKNFYLGVHYEKPNGRMARNVKLVHDSDDMAARLNLGEEKWWAWLEVDND